MISCVTGRRALLAAPRERCIVNSPGGTRTRSIPGSKPRWSSGCLPGRAQDRSRTCNRLGLSQAALPVGVHGLQVVPDGVEPSFPGCRPGVVAVGPRDRVWLSFQWSHRESHPDLQRAMLASSCWTMTPISGSRGARTHKQHICRRLLSKQVPQPFGWLPSSYCTVCNYAREGGSRGT